jgi:hypothetical protein
LLRQDALRDYRIDIETDSTIRADVERTQRNAGQFVQGFSSLLQVVGPLVQEGAIPKPQAVAILKGFAQHFKLPRSVEDAFESWGEQAQQPEPPKEDPKLAMEKARFETIDKPKFAMEQAADQRTQEFEREKHGMEMQALGAKTQAEVTKANVDLEKSNIDLAEAQASQQAAQSERTLTAESKSGEAAVVSQMQQLLAQQAQLNQQTQQAFAAMLQQMAQAVKALSAPKRILRHPQTGRVEGVVPIEQGMVQ